ncbi:hypothetical protein MC7420_4837 [Coleofasciculus chthonoplastes PCC 7420]|uniref:Uncharacterized protein n=1 Tax=Coleofasciculus chthonoplastes PCC 7420 TaxID=118168 RepID=B4VNP1_9CYAN|nr:hypothetical protein MC7420_4837 [Coleofasciculus chthonoplastes PCC 7420]
MKDLISAAGGETADPLKYPLLAGSQGGFSYLWVMSEMIVSCHAFKLGISSEQDARTTRLSPLLILRFKCRTA